MDAGGPQPRSRAKPRHTAEQVERAFALYDDGATFEQIEVETGLSRSSLYYRLQRAGRSPNRAGPTKRSESEALRIALDRVEELAVEADRLRHRLADLERENAALRAAPA